MQLPTRRKQHVSRAYLGASQAQSRARNAHASRPLLLKLRQAPVDITVDKGTGFIPEKAQQNQHFKYHRALSNSYRAVNKPLTVNLKSGPPKAGRSAAIVTAVWNMHRSGAACSLNVTSIGICLSRQQLRIDRNRAFFVAECAAAVDSPGMRDYSETTFGMLAAHEPGVFPGNS
jgi:hypothetical protein